MLQTPGRFGLLSEANSEFVPLLSADSGFASDRFYRHDTIDSRVVRLVDDAHRPFADHLDDSESSNG